MVKWFKSLSPVIQIVIVIILAIIIGAILLQLYKVWKKYKNQILLENSTATTTVAGTPITVNLGTVAQEINSAFHDYYGGLFEDEESAIISISKVPKALIPQLSELYFNVYGYNLKEEFLKYAKEDYPRIAYLFI